MNSKMKLFGAMALGLAGLGTAAYATTASAPAEQREGAYEANDDAAELAAFKGAKISLADAVGIAERATKAAATEAEFESEDGQAVFEVGLYDASGQEMEATIDAVTGKVLEAGLDDEGGEGGEDAD